jgi:hypothetical protein
MNFFKTQKIEEKKNLDETVKVIEIKKPSLTSDIN